MVSWLQSQLVKLILARSFIGTVACAETGRAHCAKPRANQCALPVRAPVISAPAQLLRTAAASIGVLAFGQLGFLLQVSTLLETSIHAPSFDRPLGLSPHSYLNSV